MNIRESFKNVIFYSTPTEYKNRRRRKKKPGDRPGAGGGRGGLSKGNGPDSRNHGKCQA